jgi:hypothetical protein
MNISFSSVSKTNSASAATGSDPLDTEHGAAADVYLAVAGQRLGPYSLPQALTKLRRNRLEAKAWLWRAGMREWVTISEYFRIRSAILGHHTLRLQR